MKRFSSRHRVSGVLCICWLAGVASGAEPPPAPSPPSSTATAATAADQQPAAAPVKPVVFYPPGAHQITGAADHYTPLLHFEPHGVLIEVPLQIAGRVESTSDFPIDRYQTRFVTGVAVAPMARLGLRLDTQKALGRIRIAAEYEHDLPTGVWTSAPQIAGEGMPNSQPIETQLRKAQARFSFANILHVGGGYMTSHWGMGLVANDGAHGWEPGSARFTDPRSGDRVVRGYIGTGPFTKANLVATIAADSVRGDDVLFPGDEAIQFLGSLLLGYDKPWAAGAYVVHRRQTAAAGGHTEVSAIDLTGRGSAMLGKRALLTVEAEAVVVVGSTTLAPTTENPIHDVLQMGIAARARIAGAYAGGVLDFLYASGDGNFDDKRQSGFKADPNYEMGLLLFRYVQTAQSGRAAITAADPSLVGIPSQNLERFANRGSATNTISLFPRVYVRPAPGFEIYGGPLLAWSAAGYANPLNSRLGGGTPRNALDGVPGVYYGTELDLGVRYRALMRGVEMTVGAEGGVLFPGSALRAASGQSMDDVYGGRFILQFRL